MKDWTTLSNSSSASTSGKALHSKHEFIQLATVLQGTQPLAQKGINDSFQGQLMLQDRTVRSAVIKDLRPKELANELMVSALASAIGMPTPVAYLALVPSGTLKVNKGPSLANGANLAFGSTFTQVPPVAQLYQGQGEAAKDKVRKRLAEWDGTGSLYGLDSWVANIDRHERNLLFSGDKEVWLIDHGHCFTGPNWKSGNLNPSQQYKNKLKNWLTPAMSQARRTSVAAAATKMSQEMTKLDVQKIGETNHVIVLLQKHDFDALISFLEQRRALVPQLATDALNLMV